METTTVQIGSKECSKSNSGMECESSTIQTGTEGLVDDEDFVTSVTHSPSDVTTDSDSGSGSGSGSTSTTNPYHDMETTTVQIGSKECSKSNSGMECESSTIQTDTEGLVDDEDFVTSVTHSPSDVTTDSGSGSISTTNPYHDMETTTVQIGSKECLKSNSGMECESSTIQTGTEGLVDDEDFVTSVTRSPSDVTTDSDSGSGSGSTSTNNPYYDMETTTIQIGSKECSKSNSGTICESSTIQTDTGVTGSGFEMESGSRMKLEGGKQHLRSKRHLLKRASDFNRPGKMERKMHPQKNKFKNFIGEIIEKMQHGS